MRKTIKYICVIASIFFMFIFIAVFILIVRTDNTFDVKPEQPIVKLNNGYSFAKELKYIQLEKIKELFPYGNYLDSANYKDIRVIKQDLMTMDSLFPANKQMNQQVFSIAVTDSLKKRIQYSFLEFNPDSLIILLHWAERFNDYSEVDKENSTLFRVIYRYWMGFITKKLDDYYLQDASLRYNYLFRFLTSRCQEHNFTPLYGYTKCEKVILYSIDSRWGYLLNRFWEGTGIIYKLIVVIIFISFVAPYYLVIRLYRRMRSIKKREP